jgi:hypothetical protein
MAAQPEGRANGRQNVGGTDQQATAQRFRSTLDYMDISPYSPPETSTVGVEIIPLLGGFIWQCGGIIAQAGILSLKVLCVMADCRSPQEDRPVNDRCQPVEKRGETRVPARSRTSSTGTHEWSSGAGGHGERLALEMTERRVRRYGLRRKWRGAGRHVMTGGVKGGDVIAVVIGIHLCSNGNGSGRVMARGRDTSHVDRRCSRRCWRVAWARAMPTCPRATQLRTLALHGRGMGRGGGAPVRRSAQG